MNAEFLKQLRECCRDDAAFERLQQLLQAVPESPVHNSNVSVTRSPHGIDRDGQIIQIINKLGQFSVQHFQTSQPLDRNQTFQAILHEFRQFLAVDRVAIYRFRPDWGGEFVNESVGDGWLSLLEVQRQNLVLLNSISECSLKRFNTINTIPTDTLIQDTQGQALRNRGLFIVDDIYQSGFSACYIETLQQYQARAYAIVPLYADERLWGLLAVYQNSGPRQWQESEIRLLMQVGTQITQTLQLASSIWNSPLLASRRQLIANIADRIRQPLDINTILATTVHETRQLLAVDRVAVYRFTPNWNGEFIAESVEVGWVPLVGEDIKKVWEDTYLQETQGGRYRNNETFAVNNIYTIGHTECHIELLEQFQAQAYAIAPIFVGKNLWGLLAAYQNSGPRTWQIEEIDLLAQIGVHLGIALQQAQLFDNLRCEVAERQQAEQQVRQLNLDLQRRNNELEIINRELESFAYSVSHDLRAPLRSIDGFSQALLEDCCDRLDPAGQDYLRRVRLATQRMGQLIDDLLTLSRVTRSDLSQESVDLSALAREIATELQQDGSHRWVDFTIQDGLIVTGDSRLLRIMLVNLLDNAWKFTSKHPRARIEFGTRMDNGKKIYFVSDDGAGFDMAYVHKLFGVFQRLHAMTDFPGNGIGLATIQRIVYRHGGRVWAEGVVEQGATFFFTLNTEFGPEQAEM